MELHMAFEKDRTRPVDTLRKNQFSAAITGDFINGFLYFLPLILTAVGNDAEGAGIN